MELQWTNQGVSDLARLYEFLALVNRPAAARTVQQLTATPSALLTNPRLGERLDEFELRAVQRLLVGGMRFGMRSQAPLSTCCDCGIVENTADDVSVG